MRRIPFALLFTLALFFLSLSASMRVAKAATSITLKPIATGFNGIVGIEHYPRTNQVIVSVGFPSGFPHNFELVSADGTHSQFTNISGLSEEVYIAAVRSGSCQGGFTSGELFTGTGAAGAIARISPDGSNVQSPWVVLPNEPGLLRGGLFQDQYCAFGGDLIVVTTAGNVWRVNSSGAPTKLASAVSFFLEGVTTVPNDLAKYGPWAGKILTGNENNSTIYTIDGQGNVVAFSLGINSPENFNIIPANQNFFGVDYGAQTLWGADASQFTGIVGDILIGDEFPGNLWQVHWNGTSFDKTLLAQVAQWEGAVFSSAGIAPIPPVTTWDFVAPYANAELTSSHSQVGSRSQDQALHGISGLFATQQEPATGKLGYTVYVWGGLLGDYNVFVPDKLNQPTQTSYVQSLIGINFTAPLAGTYRVRAEIELHGEGHAKAGSGSIDILEALIPGTLGKILGFADPAKLLPKLASAKDVVLVRVQSTETPNDTAFTSIIVNTAPTFPDSFDGYFTGTAIVETTVPLNAGDTIPIRAGLESTLKAWGNASVVVRSLDSTLKRIHVEKQ